MLSSVSGVSKIFSAVKTCKIISLSCLFPSNADTNCENVKLSSEFFNNALKNEPQNAQIYKLKALLYEVLSEDENSILAWKDCIRYAKNQDIINEANIHLEYLNRF